MIITSTTNPRIKEIVKLRDRKYRQESGLTVIDGVREISRAFHSKADLVTLFFCEERLQDDTARQVKDELAVQKIEIIEVTLPVFEKIAFGERKEGLLAVCRPLLSSWDVLKDIERPFVVVLEHVEKPGNLGAVLRSCDGAGVDALIISDTKTDVFNPNVIRASLGTVFTVPVIQAQQTDVLGFLREHKICIVATTPGAQALYNEQDLSLPVAVVLGSEQDGLKDFWLKESDVQVKVPMLGHVDSLNVSNTAAILAYEVLRQKRHA